MYFNIYSWFTVKIILIAAGVVLAGAVISLCLYCFTSGMDSLMQKRKNTEK